MARMTKEEVEAKIDAAIAEGKVYNTELTEIKDALSRMIDQALSAVSDIYFGIYRNIRDTSGHPSSEPFSEVRYSQHYPHSIPGLLKKLPKQVEPVWQPVLDAYKQFAAEWLPLAEKFISLKKVEVIKGKKPVAIAAATNIDRAALQAEKQKLQDFVAIKYGIPMFKLSRARARIREINALLRTNDTIKFGESPIFKAVLPLKIEAQDHAREEAVKQVEIRRTVLERGDWNIDALAPKPVEGDNKAQVERKNGRRFALMAICDVDKQRTVKDGPMFVTFSQPSATRFVENAVREAGVDFDAFVTKLDNKVGQHDSAEIDGQPWIGSIITIKNGGAVERWHTQQIINYSVYGKPFNQWPTRLI